MNLETLAISREGSPKWLLVGIVMCFGIAAGILLYTVTTPNAASSQVFANATR